VKEGWRALVIGPVAHRKPESIIRVEHLHANVEKGPASPQACGVYRGSLYLSILDELSVLIMAS